MQPNIYKLSEMTQEQKELVMRRAELDITEQMKVAKEVSDEIIFMHCGHIEEQGTPSDIFERPQSDRLKAFLSSSSV